MKNTVEVEHVTVASLEDKHFFNQQVDILFSSFPLGGKDGLFPPHFVRSTFPKIGGHIVSVQKHNALFYGLYMPGNGLNNTTATIRYVQRGFSEEEIKKVKDHIQSSMSHGEPVSFFDTAKKNKETFVGQLVSTHNGFDIALPNDIQARQAQELQQSVWQVDDPAYLYPFDLYHPEAGTATRLVAVHDDDVVGFLFGFYGEGKQWFGVEDGFKEGTWIESQLMGVSETYRRLGIGKSLKLQQRLDALEQGVGVIHWTVDPLQAGNAFLNLNTLGAVAVQHYEDYYPFRNSLNQVKASRIGVSWILNSDRVAALAQEEAVQLHFENFLNDSRVEIIRPIIISGGEPKSFEKNEWTPQGDTILLEIPSNWNAIQTQNTALASLWRDTSDFVLSKLLDINTMRGITGVVKDANAGSTYLVIEQLSAKLHG